MHKDILTIGPLTIHGYGLMIGLGVIAALLLTWRRAERLGESQDTVSGLALWLLLGGIAGAKLLYILTDLPGFFARPLAYLGTEGFVVYGAVLAGLATLWIWCARRGQRVLPWADLLMPAVALAQGFGRLGCLLAGCCYGRPTDSSWGLVFPADSFAPAGVPLLPTQLISSAGDFLLAGLLLWLSRRNRVPGRITAGYLAFYGTGRFLVEFLRGDPRGNVGTLSTSQFIALLTVALAGAMLLAVGRKRPGTEQTPSAADGEEA